MPIFEYTARDAAGNASSGLLQAANQAELRRALRGDHLFLTEVKTSRQSKSESTGLQTSIISGKVKPREVIVIIRQLATLVRSGVSIVSGLNTLQIQAEKPKLKSMLMELRDGVTEGRPLHAVMQSHPSFFSPITIALIESGERTGTLDKALASAADYLDREYKLRSKVKAAMVYPKLVVASSFGTVGLMLVLVVPTFKTIYKQIHGTLPGPTQALITVSGLITTYWWAILVLGIAARFAINKYRQTPAGTKLFDRYSLKIPVVGAVLRKVAIARFIQTLATSFRAGIPVIAAIQVAASTAGNSEIRDAALAVATSVRDGEPLAQELERTGEFPLMVTQMVRSGEASGTLDEMLDEINQFYDEDIKDAIDNMTKLIEPVMTFGVGGIVLFILLALYMPVFNMGKALAGKH